ncbi:SIR2 family NAD-dependent protein deacylase [Variovorax sp. LT2P21]|uniref:SIR2 family NAD-dependent protein deacylase n=1 Tax=Variovorax sp. LT2P21 TaxID=3443731 RepID=UPI003F47A95E
MHLTHQRIFENLFEGTAVPQEISLYTHELDFEQSNQLTRALGHFHHAQKTVSVLHRGECNLPLAGDQVDVRRAMGRQDMPRPVIVVTGRALDDNWFSHANDGYGLVTLVDWQIAFLSDLEGALEAAPDANILTSLALTVLLVLAQLSDIEILHDELRGCLFDLCAQKPLRAFKMRSAYVCRRCTSQLAKAGISSVETDAINSILDRVRHLVLGRTPQSVVLPLPDDKSILKDLARDCRPPPGLLNACRNGSISVLVGSGLSMQADVKVTYDAALGWKRLPSWSEVPLRLAESLKRYRGRDQVPRTTETLDEFLADLDFFRESLGDTVYYPRALVDMFAPAILNAGLANRLVFRLPVKCVLTTNYDFVLQYAAPPGTPTYTWQEAVHARSYLTSGASHRPVIKLHGCASRSNTVVLTRVEYERLAGQREYLSLLTSVFEHHTMLFVGFGLNDPRDLDNMLRQARLAGAGESEKFALLPSESCAAIASKFPQVQPIPYENHADVAKILAALVLCAETRN